MRSRWSERVQMPGNEPDSGPDREKYRGLGLFGIGWVVVACMLIGMAAGRLIDRWLGTAPWFFIGLLLLGVVAGFVELIRMALRYTR